VIVVSLVVITSAVDCLERLVLEMIRYMSGEMLNSLFTHWCGASRVLHRIHE